MKKIYPPAVVIPSDRPPTLDIARSLGRRGIQVYGIDYDPQAYGMYSKYLTPCVLPNSDDSEGNRLQYLVDLGKKLKDRAVLYPLRDDDVLLCSRERSELKKYYTYVMPDHATVTDLLTKDGLHKVAKKCNVPAPQMYISNDSRDIEAICNQIVYPVILKPVVSTSWLRPEIIAMLRDDPLSGPPKVAVCQNAEELLHTYCRIAVYDHRMIIEEVIPGEDERLSYFCFYLDRQSRPLAIFAGRKWRILPVGFGSATFVRSFRDSELEQISLKLLSGSGYQGLGGIEFKKDPRDGRYKLIEFNARLGLWDGLSMRCGIDIPYIAYCDALGWRIEAQHDYREGVKWIEFQRDARAFFLYRRKGQLSLKDWLKSLRGEKDWAIYTADDWKPALFATIKLLERPWNSLKRRLPFVSRKAA